jgi:hypothetical protein
MRITQGKHSLGCSPALAASKLITMSNWLDPYNAAAGFIFLGLFVVVPALGYLFIVLDFRAYLRSLRRSLMRVYTLAIGDPEWLRSQAVIPPCLSAFGLDLPCSEEKLKQAYFDRVKLLHPDRGGDKRKFLRLQARFEEALALVRDRASGPGPGQ